MTAMMSPSILVVAAALSVAPTLTAAYSWSFAEQPKQCKDVAVNVSGGTPPYRILVVPFGPTPLQSNSEVRTIVEQTFNGNDATLNLKLNYPANSQFVAVVSDANGFGSGGTTVATSVQNSDDSSCFDPSKSVTPRFTFAIEPPNQIVQCTPTRLWWTAGQPQGDTTFLGVIPGGKSFVVPKASLSDVPAQGQGFSWTPSVRGGTTLLLIGGDGRGNGTAGSVLNTVSSGTTSDNNGCLNQDSPSSTPGTPAGAVATASSSSGSGGSSPSSGGGGGNNTGAIVGGVVGGLIAIIALILIAVFFMRRRKHERQQKERPVDLLHSDEGDERPNQAGHLPQYYEPEPFIVPEPTVTSSDAGHTSADPRSSHAFSSSRSGTPDLLSAGGGYTPSSTSGPRKTPMKQLRPVNIIQHDDAGPSDSGPSADENDTIELPPAYTNLKPRGSAPGTPTSQHAPQMPAPETTPSPPTAGPSSRAA